MGGNGPQHTLVMRRSDRRETITSRASLEAHHSQARRSVAHVHCACELLSGRDELIELERGSVRRRAKMDASRHSSSADGRGADGKGDQQDGGARYRGWP